MGELTKVLYVFIGVLIVIFSCWQLITGFDQEYDMGLNETYNSSYFSNIQERGVAVQDYANDTVTQLTEDDEWTFMEGYYVSKNTVKIILSLLKDIPLTVISTIVLFLNAVGVGDMGPFSYVLGLIFAGIFIYFAFLIINWFRGLKDV